ncbi:hypothetical protein DFH08DRAFT_854147 [Mycena albidolilacea]|uniref:Uncharacterized protein n=1 Tax=Mycena albidolilacea TaxID=1033008 RepID=A0AAD7ABZ0_9AGAR|nr:hypothetical protein DFH08DRAFT_854147 [Mycena albidolilacea]
MESVFSIGPEESMTDQMLEGIEIESHRERQREAQRSRSARQTSTERASRRKTNAGAMRAARNATLGPLHNIENWWILKGEQCHDRCFVCGPKGSHYLPPLPPYPEEWDTFIHDRKTATLSRKFNQLFSLTALGVHDGDFMHFSPGVSAVTLNGGRTYHRILPAHEGQHAIRWFIHDPHAMFARGDDLQIPQAWINSALAGLERVNPFILELENMNAYDGDEDIALHLQYSDANPSAEIAAIISLAPAALPTRRKLVIRKKGADTPVFLDLFSPFVEPLHYLLLLPHGTLGWSPNCLNAAGNKFSQARWHRSRFFLNAEQMSIFS